MALPGRKRGGRQWHLMAANGLNMLFPFKDFELNNYNEDSFCPNSPDDATDIQQITDGSVQAEDPPRVAESEGIRPDSDSDSGS